ncbi:elongator complex protein 3 [Thermogladius sp. 4427co]|uniref:elongator complex protein 3 n=1 Tax=Thermogladius sp. 4427co TaxID=3450718 RepID=UPI003F7A35BA
MQEQQGSARILEVRKPSRLMSGVTIVAVMTHPLPCPGSCIYCPGGPSFNAPKSYFGNEPALRRARRNNFHPYKQVHERIKQYLALGHRPSKIEVIVMGGTFLAAPDAYKKWFIGMIYEALNRFPLEDPPRRVNLEEAILKNENADLRAVGLTIETRPDWGREKHADEMLYYGATRVELGVQSIYDDVLVKVRRGHSVRDSIESTRILRDAGFKIVYHIMLNLPGSDPDRDIEIVREIFENPDYRPDMLKIYPTEVVEGTELYNMWKKGEYKPLTDEEAIELISEMYRYIPKYVRVMRIRRDIPADEVAAGTKLANLRELVEDRAIEKGIPIREIRFREVGFQWYKFGKVPRPEYTRITRLTYEAGGGVEEFLAVEDVSQDILIGLLRLRIPSGKAHRWEVDSKTAIIRELHVYGPETPVGGRGLWWQHRGWGRALLEEAERIAREKYGCRKILVLSGVGAREYYRRLGYYRPPDSPYMWKYLG